MANEDDDVADLVSLAQSGDQNAVALLIRRYHRHVYQTAFAVLRSRQDAEEVTQEAFIHMYSKLSQLREARAFVSWLTTLTTRLSIDLSRRNKRRTTDSFDEIDENKLGRASDPLTRAILDEALGRLTPIHRAVLLLRERDGYEYAEIAKMLKIPIGTVKSRLANARLALTRTLDAKEEKMP